MSEAARVRQILFPSDLSTQSDRAFEHAALLAERLRARLTLYHVVRGATHSGAADPRDPRLEALRRAETAARAHLERRASSLSSDWEIRIDHDASVTQALLGAILDRKPDLTVMSTHGRDVLAHLFLGSVAETVVCLGRSPVLCVREPDHGVALPYRRILVPTDMSPGSRWAFPRAALLARAFGAEVIALHVAPAPRGDPAFGTSGIAYDMEWRVPSEERLRAFLDPDFAGLKVVPQVQVGSAWGRIHDTARAERADLIVMSTHGHDSLSDRVLGSHAERVVRHAPCPVLVV